MKRFKELGISLEELKTMPPKDVEAAFYPPENLKRTEKPLPDFFQIHARMAAMEHPNLAFLWLEYKAAARRISPSFTETISMNAAARIAISTPARQNTHAEIFSRWKPIV